MKITTSDHREVSCMTTFRALSISNVLFPANNQSPPTPKRHEIFIWSATAPQYVPEIQISRDAFDSQGKQHFPPSDRDTRTRNKVQRRSASSALLLNSHIDGPNPRTRTFAATTQPSSQRLPVVLIYHFQRMHRLGVKMVKHGSVHLRQPHLICERSAARFFAGPCAERLVRACRALRNRQAGEIGTVTELVASPWLRSTRRVISSAR